MNVSKKIVFNDFLFYISVILCCYFVFLNETIYAFPATERWLVYINIILLCLIGSLFVLEGFFLAKGEIASFALFVFFFIFGFISAFYNKQKFQNTDTVAYFFRDVGFIFEMLLLSTYSSKERIKKAVCVIFYFLFATVAINDILIFSIGDFGRSAGGLFYLVGTKFSVSYLHMLLICFYLEKQYVSSSKVNYCFILLLVCYSFGIAKYVDCNTGIIGLALLIMILIAYRVAGKNFFVFSPVAFLIINLLCILFPYIYSWLLNNAFAKFIIVDVLKRDMTLTGRTEIYAMLKEVIHTKAVLGYGYGTGNRVAKFYTGYANWQNGFNQWLVQVGVIAFVLLLTFVLCIFSSYIKKEKSNLGIPIIAFIYSLTLLSAIEITVNMSYFFPIIILYAGLVCLNREELSLDDSTGNESK